MFKIHPKKLLGICFVVILVAGFLAGIFLPKEVFSEEENRILQEKPAFSLSSYMEGRFEKKFESYVDDHFPLRNSFIKIKTSADVTLGKLESNGVYRCKDNYLMENLVIPSDDFIDRTTDALASFKKDNSNLKMSFLLAPNAAAVLTDKLPNTLKMEDQNKYIDEFFDKAKDAGITPIDVRKDFAKKAASTQLYYKTDHHWTTDGAYLAYQTAAKKLQLNDSLNYEPIAVKNDFRGTLASKSGFVNGENDAIKIYLPDDEDYNNSVIYYSDSKVKTTEFYQLDNLKTKDAYTVFGGSNHPIYTIKTPTRSNEKLLIIKDSYANSFIPFIAQNYREIVVVDPRYFFDDIEDIIKAEGITQVLFLYNANTFFSDHSLEMMLDA